MRKCAKIQKISEEIYKRIDNRIYDMESERWWQPDFSLNLLKTLYNPFRIIYVKRIFQQFNRDSVKKTVLEVGCGGGLFTEELAKMGFITTGIDPSEQSLNIAAKHAEDNNLKIIYKKGFGENLPFGDNSFDIVICCDVLEHVHDLPKVISEISRVLKNEGIFIYDTFNRTYLSYIGAIKILQDWKRWAIIPPNLHVWEMFIKPDEIISLLRKNRLDWKEHCGIKPDISYFRLLHYLRKRSAGKMTHEEFSKKFLMVESSSTQVVYIGYSVKKQ